jgi:energy-coupling factor transport system permease protein
MIMTIALRFIPTLMEEADKIMNAQKARGADFTNGSLIQRAKALIPILIPLFSSSIRHALDLATAMECRCYKGGEGRTRMKILHCQASDIFALFLAIALGVAVVCINIFLTPFLPF